MSKHLMMSGGAENWILDDHYDLADLGRTLEAAMINGEVLQLEVLLPDNLTAPTTLLFNGQAAAAVALVEL